MSDEQFADAIGVTRQSVGTYETRAFAPRGDVFSKIIAVTRQPPGFSQRRASTPPSNS